MTERSPVVTNRGFGDMRGMEGESGRASEELCGHDCSESVDEGRVKALNEQSRAKNLLPLDGFLEVRQRGEVQAALRQTIALAELCVEESLLHS